MIPYFTTAETIADLEGILVLQGINLATRLEQEEIRSQGFVTVEHTLEMIRSLNEQERHIIAKLGDQIIGYVLAMTKKSRAEVPVLLQMFEEFDAVPFMGKPVSAYNYIVAGQVCVAKPFRGTGILDGCYQFYRERYAQKYDFLITEIARANTRSLNAHHRIGFRHVHSYTDSGHTEWEVVVWHWKG